MKSIDESTAAKANSFNFFINLFDNGEFNELVVTQGVDGYQVELDNETYMCTLAQDSNHCWKLIKGSIPSFVISEITQRIDRKLSN
ncbi:hypothetical protein BDE36_3018 [Arcticibacter tournemirensis]|uniref:Uncharacterized protein n=1 Tax=Arcticibacter tournemirensis TaxID=699437 RepID=A0A4V1KIZ0_9SPHI|nr:hypothetical protein [Arcticibacter tournemirensis]KAA8476411.1 hypothetical protein F1649_20060 [Arcticibacter tournemirensis]RXF72362.1 hypothetical protein EKH83_01130 [Arcticibacter tournemirensis]TQM51243.1 hypothetical protein BDE36_3018 [Arcticibacter tournemirensis]